MRYLICNIIILFVFSQQNFSQWAMQQFGGEAEIFKRMS
jgi:hypothetical protein